MTRSPLFRFLAPTLCGASALLAQTSAVVPPANATAEGNSLDLEPFGFQQINHLQYVDRSLLTAVPAASSINQVAYRRDYATYTVTPMRRLIRNAPATAIWEVWMVNYTGPVLNPTNNIRRAGWTNVMTPILVNFPDLARGTGPTAPFDLQFMLDRPFLYSGGSLGIGHYAYETTGGTVTYLMDSVVSSVTTGSADRISPSSVGCPAGENRCEASAPNPGAGNLEFYLYGAKPLTLAAAYLGTNTTDWLGVPLPLNLGVVGLAPCNVYTDLAVAIAGVQTNIAGVAAARTPVPADEALISATLYGQWIVDDDRVNPAFPVATSDGMRFTLGPALGQFSIPMSIVSAGQFLANGATGFVRPGEGLVFRLSW
jgi:hypothetical protein